MPWEKSFDEEAAVESAMEVFWQKGFAPASIADLMAGTGLNKGSLYNAFGGKRQLFVRALLKYDADRRQTLLSKLESLDDPLQAVTGFFDAILTETLTDEERKGCFLFNTALDLGVHDEEVQALVSKGVREIEAFFRRCIEVGQARNEIDTNINPEDTSKALLSMAIAIRVLGRGTYTTSSLTSIANEAKRQLQSR